MSYKGFASVALAALMGVAFASPAHAGSPGFTSSGAVQGQSGAVAPAIAAYYARGGKALWVVGGRPTDAALQLLDALDRSPLDGLASGPSAARQARAALALAASGDAAAARNAETLLSTAFLLYARAMRTPPPGMEFADTWVKPRTASPAQILASAAAAPSLAEYVRGIANPNPVYASLRAAAARDYALTGGADQRVLASLDRVRAAPFQKRYVMVDAASATLWMIENGRVADSMKVVVGKSESRTPMIASTIYYATLNPYWNVPADLVRKLIAPKVVAQGMTYLSDRKYEVFDSYGKDAKQIDPKTVDWAAVARGDLVVKVRQNPGPANSMGTMKFGFPNRSDIFLHDTPNKDVFASDQRNISNGCIRLSDAPRLARWLLGGEAEASGSTPEQHVQLPTPVPIYITYMTATADAGQLRYVSDVYAKDSGTAGLSIAARR